MEYFGRQEVSRYNFVRIAFVDRRKYISYINTIFQMQEAGAIFTRNTSGGTHDENICQKLRLVR